MADDLEYPGKKYVGRSSGPKDAPVQEILDKRAAGHHRKLGPLTLDKASINKEAIRGREQMLLDKFRNDGIDTVQINGVSPKNPNAPTYRIEAEEVFGKP